MDNLSGERPVALLVFGHSWDKRETH